MKARDSGDNLVGSFTDGGSFFFLTVFWKHVVKALLPWCSLHFSWRLPEIVLSWRGARCHPQKSLRKRLYHIQVISSSFLPALWCIKQKSHQLPKIQFKIWTKKVDSPLWHGRKESEDGCKCCSGFFYLGSVFCQLFPLAVFPQELLIYWVKLKSDEISIVSDEPVTKATTTRDPGNKATTTRDPGNQATTPKDLGNKATTTKGSGDKASLINIATTSTALALLASVPQGHVWAWEQCELPI